MALTIIAAASRFPQRTRLIARDAPMSCTRPIADDSAFALDGALEASRAALSGAGLAPAQIGLLISKGISPTHVALDPDVMGPRVGHPLQHALGANDALVFDMCDADWASTLDTAEMMLASLDQSFALLVHSEHSAPSVAPDGQSGFALSDGAGVLIVRREPGPPGRASYVALDRALPSARMLMQDPTSASEGPAWISLQWSATSELTRAIADALRSALMAQADHARAQAPIAALVESWFPGHEPRDLAKAITKAPQAPPGLGALTLPFLAAAELQHGVACTALLACVNPFHLHASCRSVAMARPT